MRCWWQNNHGDARNGLSHFSWSQVQNVYFKRQAQLVGQTEQGLHVTSEDLSLGGRNGLLVLELALNALTPWLFLSLAWTFDCVYKTLTVDVTSSIHDQAPAEVLKRAWILMGTGGLRKLAKRPPMASSWLLHVPHHS